MVFYGFAGLHMNLRSKMKSVYTTRNPNRKPYISSIPASSIAVILNNVMVPKLIISNKTSTSISAMQGDIALWSAWYRKDNAC
jgi:hypothetical protein